MSDGCSVSRDDPANTTQGYFLLRTSPNAWATMIHMAMLMTDLMMFMINTSLFAGDTNDYNSTAHRNKRMCMTPLVELDEYIIHGRVPFICEIVEGRSGLR